MRAKLAIFSFFGLVIALTPNVGGFVTEPILPAAHAEEAALESLAAQLRRQGHRCDDPVHAERDAERSKPDELVWVIKCTNASYRMRLIPHMAAHVEQI
jgi:hypothetical protein